MKTPPNIMPSSTSSIFGGKEGSGDDPVRTLCVLGSGGHWNPEARHLLTRWSRFAPGNGTSHGACDICNKELGGRSRVKLYGHYYNSVRFMEKGLLDLSDRDPDGERSATLEVGSACAQKARYFHRLWHFKLRCLTEMEKRAKLALEQQPALAGDHNAKKLVGAIVSDSFVSRTLAELTNTVEAALSIDQNPRRRAVE